MNWLFKALDRIYEGQFMARFQDAEDAREGKRFWGQVLRRVSERQMVDALGRCLLEHPTFPPKAGEFLHLCSPSMDYYLNAFQEARNNAIARISNQRATQSKEALQLQWSHPAVYWAAVRFGYADLSTSSWAQAQARWKVLFDAELAKGDAIEAVPEHREALPSPGRTITTIEQGRTKIAAILAQQRSRSGLA